MVEITSITPPAVGWPIVTHCPLCKATTIILSVYAIKPEDGDYWKISDMCMHEELQHLHGIKLAMAKTEPKLMKDYPW